MGEKTDGENIQLRTAHGLVKELGGSKDLWLFSFHAGELPGIVREGRVWFDVQDARDLVRRQKRVLGQGRSPHMAGVEFRGQRGGK